MPSNCLNKANTGTFWVHKMERKYNAPELALKFTIHCFRSRNRKGHGVHSPYLYNYIQYVIRERKPYYYFAEVESLRKELLRNKTVLQFPDPGTGEKSVRKVSDIARNALKGKRQAQLLYRTVNHFKSLNVLELGTSLGVSTLYLAGSSSTINCTTIEANSAVLDIARENFRKMKAANIRTIEANLDQVTLNRSGKWDLIFMDANHKYEPTIRYFNQCIEALAENGIIIIDDIHWSNGMEKAWKKIRDHEKVRASLDLFHMGIIFTNKFLARKNYKLIF